MDKRKFILLPIILFALLGLFLNNNNIKANILLPHFNNDVNTLYLGENNGQYAYLNNYTTKLYSPFSIETIIKIYDGKFEGFGNEFGNAGSPAIIFYEDYGRYFQIGSDIRYTTSGIFFAIYDSGCIPYYNLKLYIGNFNEWYHFVIQLSIAISPSPDYTMIYFKIWRNGTLIHEGAKQCYYGNLQEFRLRLGKGYYVYEYASNFTISILRIYDYWLSEAEIIHNYYYPYANYITNKLRYDYHPSTYDNVLRIWYNKGNSYNQNTNLPYFILKNNDNILYALGFTTITQTITTTIPVDYTNYYCASLLFIPFAFGLLFFFVERRLILTGIGLGFMFLHFFVNVSFVYFLLGSLLIFLNIILLRYQIIEKE